MKQVVLVWCLSLGLFLHAFAQEQLVTYDFRNTPLADVLVQLHEQTLIDFAYDNFATAKILINAQASQVPLSVALMQLLQPTEYHFIIVGSTYVIAKHLKESKQPVLSYNDILSSIVATGNIYDTESKETLPFAGIYNQNTRQNFMTNEYGQFHCVFQMAHPTDTIVFQYVGYETKKLLLHQIINQKPHARIELVSQRLYFPTVMVTAGSNALFDRDEDNNNLVYNPNDIVAASGLGEADIFRTTQLLPGISSNQENSGGLLIRGSSADQTMLQLDGFTIYHQDHLFGMFSAVNSHAVKNVRVHKNTPQSRYAGRIGGLVEMVGKEGNTQDGITQINLGMLSGALSIEGPLDTAGKLGFIFNGRRSFTDGWYSPTYRRLFSTIYNSAIVTSDTTANNTFEGQNDPKYYFQDANMKLTWKPNLNNKLNVSFYASRDQLYIHYADTSRTASQLAPQVLYTDESRWKNTGFSFQYLHQRTPGSSLLLRITLSNYNATYFSTDTINSINEVETTRIQNTETNLSNLKYTAEKQWARLYHAIAAGVESEQVSSSREHAYSAEEIPLTKQNTWWHSAYIQDAWSPSLKWRVNGGWRMIHDTYTQKYLQEPRVTVAYRLPLHRIRLELGYARIHQLIHRIRPQNLYQNNPDYWALSNNQQIPILASDQFNFAFQKELNKGHIHMDLFARMNQGSTLYLASLPGYEPGIDRSENNLLIQGTSQSHGIELSTFFHHLFHQLLLSYTWLSSTGNYDALDNELLISSSEHRHEFKLYYEWQSRNWDYSVFWTYGSGRPFTPALGTYTFTYPTGESSNHLVYGNFNSQRLPAYHRLDLSVNYKVDWKKTKAKIGVSIYNAYNRTNIRSRQYFVNPQTQSSTMNIYESNLSMLGMVPSINLELRF